MLNMLMNKDVYEFILFIGAMTGVAMMVVGMYGLVVVDQRLREAHACVNSTHILVKQFIADQEKEMDTLVLLAGGGVILITAAMSGAQYFYHGRFM